MSKARSLKWFKTWRSHY